jgi:DNA polymerase III subunit epsilon
MARPDVQMPIPTAAAIHGLTDADVAKCRSFVGIARKLALFLDGCDLAGFGIKKFDLPLLIAEFRRAEVSFPLVGRAVIDELQVYHQREPRDLQSAFTFCVGGRFVGAHRARCDVKATALVLDAMMRRYGDMPKNVRVLHRQLTDVDLGGWFRRDAGRIVFAC